MDSRPRLQSASTGGMPERSANEVMAEKRAIQRRESRDVERLPLSGDRGGGAADGAGLRGGRPCGDKDGHRHGGAQDRQRWSGGVKQHSYQRGIHDFQIGW
jgi:hypothetical protein